MPRADGVRMHTPIASMVDMTADPAQQARTQAFEGRIADSATAAMLAAELVKRLDARVAELERLSARMRDALQQLGQTVW